MLLASVDSDAFFRSATVVSYVPLAPCSQITAAVLFPRAPHKPLSNSFKTEGANDQMIHCIVMLVVRV